MLPSGLRIFGSLGTAVLSFDLASVAICPSTSRCSQCQAETICSADLPLAGVDRAAQHFPVKRHNVLAGLGHASHEELKAAAELPQARAGGITG